MNVFESLKILLKKYGSVQKIAIGFASGVFVSITPTFGFHMIIALILSTLFKINRASTLLGTWFNNPLTTPIVYYLDYKIGAYLLNINYIAFSLKPFTLDHYFSLGTAIFLPTIAGSIVLGIPISLICYYVTLFFLRRAPLFGISNKKLIYDRFEREV